MSDADGDFFKEAPIAPGSKKSDEQKPERARGFLGIPLELSARNSLETFAEVAAYSTGNETDSRVGRVLRNGSVRGHSSSPDPARAWNAQPVTFWSRNKGLILVVLAQAFGALMSLTTRLLETEGSHGSSMHPFQILFVRMFITLLFSLVYMYWAKIPHAPLGHKDVRALLVARGIAGLVSLFGVILIARPASLFPGSLGTPPNPKETDGSIVVTNSTALTNSDEQSGITLSQRFAAIGFALVGVCGAACAYTTLRWIGKRAHPLISITYYAGWCICVSTVAIVAIPSVGFRLPSNFQEWGLLALLGLSGFIMQLLITAGLAHEKSSRATNMIYTQILFALAFDKLIFDTTPGGWSIIGSSLVLGSALYIAVHKGKETKNTSVEDVEAEELNLMAGSDDEENERNRIDTRRLRGL
ncbi:MAG: hypothetical protein Q9195_001909 [Heterodermia aff. obscurata]